MLHIAHYEQHLKSNTCTTIKKEMQSVFCEHLPLTQQNITLQ